MAFCEKCGTSGHDMRDMAADDDKKQFVGPCCVKAQPDKVFSNDLEYGVEFSSHMGLRAYASYGGLAVEFKKTKEELNQWMTPKEQNQEMSTEDPQPEETTSQTLN